MKCLTLVTHASAKDDLIDFLLHHDKITGFTLTASEGHSRSTGDNPLESSRDRVLGYVPRVRIDVIVDEETLQSVLDQLCDCDSCVTGRGVWWVTPVEKWGGL